MKRSALAPNPASEFSRPLRVADLSGTAEKVSANATKSEREALARRFKVREVSRLGSRTLSGVGVRREPDLRVVARNRRNQSR